MSWNKAEANRNEDLAADALEQFLPKADWILKSQFGGYIRLGPYHFVAVDHNRGTDFRIYAGEKLLATAEYKHDLEWSNRYSPEDYAFFEARHQCLGYGVPAFVLGPTFGFRVYPKRRPGRRLSYQEVATRVFN